MDKREYPINQHRGLTSVGKKKVEEEQKNMVLKLKFLWDTDHRKILHTMMNLVQKPDLKAYVKKLQSQQVVAFLGCYESRCNCSLNTCSILWVYFPKGADEDQIVIFVFKSPHKITIAKLTDDTKGSIRSHQAWWSPLACAEAWECWPVWKSTLSLSIPSSHDC